MAISRGLLYGRKSISQGDQRFFVCLTIGWFLTRLRNHVPWALIAACNFTAALLLLILRFILSTENKRREGSTHDGTYDDVHVSHVNDDGTTQEKKVDKVIFIASDLFETP